MSSINKHTVIGRVGSDPKHQEFNGEIKSVTFTVATSERWKDKKTGEMKEQTEWHRIKTTPFTLDFALNHVRKGALVIVEGPNKTNKFTNKEGQEVELHEIHAREIKMLVWPKDQQATSETNAATKYYDQATKADKFEDDDIPF